MAPGELSLASPSNATTEILSALAREAGKPLARARTAPPSLYNSPEIYALEQEKIFKRDWIAVGLAAEIAKPGDYLTYTIANQSIIVMRDKDNEIRGLSNVCRHRMMILLRGRGHVNRITCPSHA